FVTPSIDITCPSYVYPASPALLSPLAGHHLSSSFFLRIVARSMIISVRCLTKKGVSAFYFYLTGYHSTGANSPTAAKARTLIEIALVLWHDKCNFHSN
ncbi:hypothetical protein BLOT_006799, partial [Blomia tropicalis]